ncbi:DUF3592 domain-containing protein [Thermobifida cellulosilytica]|uniref:DUF3592 domain-containing protein n=1 Tax=Thermobifida cellulosilytica TaxID=144786 RepID=UPI00083839A5|nr:DUF3592 domain-containing protein [Thermobifida cellulosilytica]
MSSSSRNVDLLVLAGVSAVLFVLSVVFVVVGNADYTSYTGRAEAVVVERDEDYWRTSSGDTRRDIDVYVSYRTEEGVQLDHVKLGGLNPSDHHEGEQLQIAYHPEHPGDPVTVQSTEEGAFGVFRVIGAGLAALGAGFAAWAAVLFLRRRRA